MTLRGAVESKEAAVIGMDCRTPRVCSGLHLAADCLSAILQVNSSAISLDKLDHFVADELGFQYYGRYVDDFYLVDKDKKGLLDAIGKIRTFLSEELSLTLHPRKIYLQPVTHGAHFLGAVLKPTSRFPAKRTLSKYHRTLSESIPIEQDPFRRAAVLQSYRGYFPNTASYFPTCS